MGPVPRFPPEEIQKQFVGASYEHALLAMMFCASRKCREMQRKVQRLATTF